MLLTKYQIPSEPDFPGKARPYFNLLIVWQELMSNEPSNIGIGIYLSKQNPHYYQEDVYIRMWINPFKLRHFKISTEEEKLLPIG